MDSARKDAAAGNVDVLWTSSIPGPASRGADFVVGGIENYVCIAHQAGGTDGSSKAIRVVVFDAGGDVSAALREAPTVVIETTFDAVPTLVGWARAGGKVWLVYTALGGSGPYTAARAFRLDSVSFDPTETVIFAGVAVGAVSSNGTFVFTVHPLVPGGYVVQQYDENMGLVASTTETGLLLAQQEQAIDGRSGFVDIARRDIATGSVYVDRYTVGLSQVLANKLIASGGASGGLREPYHCADHFQ